MAKMPSAAEMAVALARENERLKIQLEQAIQRIKELEALLAEKG